MTITHARLIEILHYDPLIGVWKRKVSGRGGHGAKAGDVVGSINGKGYSQARIDGKIYQLHRLAFLWMTGILPEGPIDHVNLDKADNRWSNLRLSTNSLNIANTLVRASNTSGLKGVCWHKRDQKYQAQIRVAGKLMHLGCFDTVEEAGAAYSAAAKEHFGEFARSV